MQTKRVRNLPFGHGNARHCGLHSLVGSTDYSSGQNRRGEKNLLPVMAQGLADVRFSKRYRDGYEYQLVLTLGIALWCLFILSLCAFAATRSLREIEIKNETRLRFRNRSLDQDPTVRAPARGHFERVAVSHAPSEKRFRRSGRGRHFQTVGLHQKTKVRIVPGVSWNARGQGERSPTD